MCRFELNSRRSNGKENVVAPGSKIYITSVGMKSVVLFSENVKFRNKK